MTTNLTQEHRCKNPRQTNSKPNRTIYKKGNTRRHGFIRNV